MPYRSHEPKPEHVSLHFKGELPAKIVEGALRPLPCTLCRERITYKKGQFDKKKPEIPFLILLHNSARYDENTFFEDPDENALFIDMIEKTTHFHPRQFLVRELLRCEFDQLTADGLKSWIPNCSRHIYDDIDRFNIRGLLIVGQAASLLFPDKEKRLEMVGKKITQYGIPTVITPGPGRIIYLEKKKAPKATILEEKRRIYHAILCFKNEVMKI